MIKCDADVIVRCPPELATNASKKNAWRFSRRVTGMGATKKVKKLVSDVNGDGRTILRVLCPAHVEATVRDSSGHRLAFIASTENKVDVKIEAAGEITVKFKEVR